MTAFASSARPDIQAAAHQLLTFGQGGRLDLAARTLHLDGHRVALTRREFTLLSFLASHPHRAFSRNELLEAVWDQGFDGFPHTVSAHVQRLRTKIEADAEQPRLIITVWGFGYRFEP